MKKKLMQIITMAMTLFVFTGCGSLTNEEADNIPKEDREIKVIVPDGLPSMAMAKMIKENPEIIDGYNVSYSIEKTAENVVSGVLKGEVDIAVVPSNVAATQYNKNAGYKIVATTGWGAFYLISLDGEKAIDDLKGEEIYNIGKGLTPDIVTKSILKDTEYDIEADFNFSYVNGVTELAPMILAGKTKYAVVPEPAFSQISSKKPELKVVMDLNEEWKNNNSSDYGFPQATIIVKEDLIENDSKFIDVFLDKVEESTIFANENREELANYCEEIGVSADKSIISKAIDKANIKFVKISDSKDEYKTYFNKLNDFDPVTIGGKVPDEGVFMEK